MDDHHPRRVGMKAASATLVIIVLLTASADAKLSAEPAICPDGLHRRCRRSRFNCERNRPRRLVMQMENNASSFVTSSQRAVDHQSTRSQPPAADRRRGTVSDRRRLDLAMELARRDRRRALAPERRTVRRDVRARFVHASHEWPRGRNREPDFGNTFTATGELA